MGETTPALEAPHSHMAWGLSGHMSVQKAALLKKVRVRVQGPDLHSLLWEEVVRGACGAVPPNPNLPCRHWAHL